MLVREAVLTSQEREIVEISVQVGIQERNKGEKNSAGLTEEPGTKTLIVGDHKFSGLDGIIGKHL